jgi:hypothetical protein
MEYSLLKTIEPNLGLQMCPVRNPHLTPYPAIDYINPGLGHAARLYSFYVPLHATESPFNITKKEEQALSQEGGAKDTVEDTDNVSVLDNDPTQFNERKRKLMGDAVHSSFLHPKILTGQIDLEPQSKVKKKNEIFKSENLTKLGKGKNVKHKFQFD